MIRPAAAIALIALMGASANAQQTPAARRDADVADVRSALDRAIQFYQSFQVEKARLLLDSVMTRKDLLTPIEAASAHKFLGASYAVLAKPDSAAAHFAEALKLDPATDLDPAKFSASELAPFAEARRSWLRQLSPDSSLAIQKRLQIATLRLGSATPNATFFVNGASQGPIGSYSPWIVPAGKPIKISIRSKNCSSAWDSTVTVNAAETVTIGRRQAFGCKP